jgi:hypothetical protein
LRNPRERLRNPRAAPLRDTARSRDFSANRGKPAAGTSRA